MVRCGATAAAFSAHRDACDEAHAARQSGQGLFHLAGTFLEVHISKSGYIRPVLPNIANNTHMYSGVTMGCFAQTVWICGVIIRVRPTHRQLVGVWPKDLLQVTRVLVHHRL